jgi:N-acetylmuramoyl-L-alanine amidase
VKRATSDSGLFRVLAVLLLGVVFGTTAPPPAAATEVSSLLAGAEREFTVLKRKKSLQKYRHNYEKIEKKLRRVYERHPKSREAETALLRGGELYTFLYRWTSGRGDLDESQRYYRRLIRDYPKSRLVDDAQVAIALLYLNYYNDPVQAYREFEKVSLLSPKGDQVAEASRWLRKLRRYRPSSSSAAKTAPRAAAGKAPRKSSPAAPLLSRAEKKFNDLKKTTSRQKYRHNYDNVLREYRKVFEKHPGSSEAATALLRAGELHALLFRWTKLQSDLNLARHYYQRLLKSYPDSALADDAQLAIAFLFVDQYEDPARAYAEFQKVVRSFPRGDKRAEANRQMQKLSRYKPVEKAAPSPSSPVSTSLARVKDIRHWSNPKYTRVVIDLDEPTNFYSNLLKESSAQHKPPRLYIDLFNSLVTSRLQRTIPINDGILLSIRAGQFTPDTVRVVLDINDLKGYNIFPMENPFRLVIDATGGRKNGAAIVASPSAPARAPSPRPSPSATSPNTRYSLAQQLGLGIRRVVIDAGHGARDPGAVGVGGLKEKDVTLDIALRLRDILLRQGLEVTLTRDRDRYLGLAERTGIANRANADLFVSLHANSSKRSNLRGVETYFLNLASSQRAMETAAKENSMSVAKMSNLDEIVKEIFNSKMDESSRLAEIVQQNIVRNLRRHYGDLKDLGVKQAPFYVLIGANMPSILAEVSFINHPVEGKRLATDSYRQRIAEALSSGVQDYIQSVKVASTN